MGNHNATVASLVMGACTQATASDANAYVGSDTSFCNKVDVTVANTTTGATDKCVYPTQAAAVPGAVEHLQPVHSWRGHDATTPSR